MVIILFIFAVIVTFGLFAIVLYFVLKKTKEIKHDLNTVLSFIHGARENPQSIDSLKIKKEIIKIYELIKSNIKLQESFKKSLKELVESPKITDIIEEEYKN